MKILDIRDQIWDAVSEIRPLDNTEREHIDYVLKWIQSGVEIFRTEKPATPPMHLIFYFLVFSPEQSKVLFGRSQKSGVMAPSRWPCRAR